MGTTEQALLVAGLVNVAFGMGGFVTAGVAAVKIVANNHLEFNAIWGARLALVIMAAFWSLSPVINSEVLWSPSDGYAFKLSEDIVPHICRGYMVLKYGVAEPVFLLIIIHIVKFTPGDVGSHWLANHKNMQIVWNAFFLVGTIRSGAGGTRGCPAAGCAGHPRRVLGTAVQGQC